MTDRQASPEFLWHRLSRAHRNTLQLHMDQAGLGRVGHPMLLSILRSSDRTGSDVSHAQRELAELLDISPAAVTASLKSLERGGYIRRERLEHDARKNRIYMTDKGREAVAGCKQCFQAVNAQMLQGFSQQERETLAGLLQRMTDNLQQPGETGQSLHCRHRRHRHKEEDAPC